MTDSDLLQAILARQDAILAAVHALQAAQSGRRPLSQADAARLASLLPAIHAACDDAVFPLAELLTLAMLPAHGGLAAALAPHLDSSRTLRALGKLFARCAGHRVGNLCLQHVGSERNGALWQIVRV